MNDNSCLREIAVHSYFPGCKRDNYFREETGFLITNRFAAFQYTLYPFQSFLFAAK
jgi:hypothetical protein